MGYGLQISAEQQWGMGRLSELYLCWIKQHEKPYTKTKTEITRGKTSHIQNKSEPLEKTKKNPQSFL